MLNSFQALKKACDVSRVSFVSGYAGYIASNFLNEFTNVTQAINETSAIAFAHVQSYLGKRSIVIMKNAGLNEAALAFRNSCDIGTNAGMIILFTDDLNGEMSENRQDSRIYYELGKTLLFEPKSPKEIYDMVNEAFILSEKIGLPILIRVTNALNNPKLKENINLKNIAVRKIQRAKRDQSVWVMHPRNTKSTRNRHDKKYEKIVKYVEKSNFNSLIGKGKSCVAYSQALTEKEVKMLANYEKIIKIGTFPLPQKLVKKAIKSEKETDIIDSGEGFLERQIEQALGNKGKVKTFDRNAPPGNIHPNSNYRKLFKIIKDQKPTFVAGDFGAYLLAPESPIEYALHYGGAISSAIGAYLMGEKKVYCIVGDGGFTTGVENIFEAVRKKANINIVIIQNAGISEKESINLDVLDLAKQKGMHFVKRIKEKELDKKYFKQMEDFGGPSVLIVDYN